jgi:hypothetical protein
MSEDELMSHMIAAEAIIKGELVKYADEHLTSGQDKSALVGAVSLAVAGAAIIAARQCLEMSGNRAIGEFTVGVFKQVVVPELEQLKGALHKGRDGDA